MRAAWVVTVRRWEGGRGSSHGGGASETKEVCARLAVEESGHLGRVPAMPSNNIHGDARACSVFGCCRQLVICSWQEKLFILTVGILALLFIIDKGINPVAWRSEFAAMSSAELIKALFLAVGDFTSLRLIFSPRYDPCTDESLNIALLASSH